MSVGSAVARRGPVASARAVSTGAESTEVQPAEPSTRRGPAVPVRLHRGRAGTRLLKPGASAPGCWVEAGTHLTLFRINWTLGRVVLGGTPARAPGYIGLNTTARMNRTAKTARMAPPTATRPRPSSIQNGPIRRRRASPSSSGTVIAEHVTSDVRQRHAARCLRCRCLGRLDAAGSRHAVGSSPIHRFVRGVGGGGVRTSRSRSGPCGEGRAARTPKASRRRASLHLRPPPRTGTDV